MRPTAGKFTEIYHIADNFFKEIYKKIQFQAINVTVISSASQALLQQFTMLKRK
jgi:2-hydroxy-3-keto-5-methylthiopentenyl-1-phosphate phosphatase